MVRIAKIFINPGHGSPDPGAIGPSGLQEKDVVFEVGNLAADYLRAVGYEVLVLQSNYLRGVIDKANDVGADLFISIHCNSVATPQAHGTETFCHPQSIRSEKLARTIQNQLVGEFGLTNRGVKTSTKLGVLNLTDMPAALAELAFISNPEEERLLANEQDRWARAVARGISDYFLVEKLVLSKRE